MFSKNASETFKLKYSKAYLQRTLRYTRESDLTVINKNYFAKPTFS